MLILKEIASFGKAANAPHPAEGRIVGEACKVLRGRRIYTVISGTISAMTIPSTRDLHRLAHQTLKDPK
jgi:hypothetical protein